jgi:hypothetical protein
MNTEPTSLALVLVGLLFAAFILLKLYRPAIARTPQRKQAKRRIAEAKKRARDKSLQPALRASAWREAATAALETMKHPSLAATYARRAERLDPNDAEAVGLLALSLRRAARYRALERFLWRRLAAGDNPDAAPSAIEGSNVAGGDGRGGEQGAGYDRAFSELLKLYEGPLRRPEIAEALRRLRS